MLLSRDEILKHMVKGTIVIDPFSDSDIHILPTAIKFPFQKISQHDHKNMSLSTGLCLDKGGMDI